MKIAHSHVILDACCLLNFGASGHLLAILQAIPAQVVVTKVVKEGELKTFQRLEAEDNQGALQFEAAIAQGKLIIVDFESEAEAESFINYVFELGDEGESASCAIALHRAWAIGTDDKRAISFMRREKLPLQIISTPEIIKHWSEVARIDSATLRDALNAIQNKARYVPPTSHPLRRWWTSVVAE